MKTKVKKLISGILSVTLLSTTLTYFPVIAEDTGKYPYTMFAGSSEEGAITINASNVCINGNIATNGTIVSSGNMNVNGSKTENAAEEMLYFFNKLDYAYFNSSNVEIHTEDYSYEDTNININVPLEVEGELELTGNINLSTGIKALEDVNLNGEVKNTNESVICSETGDIIINTTNVNLNGLVYAPEGCVDITAQNLNMNNVIIIADTIKVECPNLNANYSNSMGEFIGMESEVDLELFAYGEYISESNSINVFWNTTVPKGTFNVQISYDNEAYTSVGTVTDVESYNYAISEEFEKMYIKVTETTNYGESYDAVPFVVRKAEDGYMIDFLDSDEDDLPDIFEIEIGTNIDISDSDEDGLTDYQEVYFTDTDPTVYDSVTEGIRDADIDSDGDGLSNIFELENEIDPLLEDTDDDGLSDYDEIYVYGTNPAIPDTDEDNIEDGAEIKLGLDPNNPETFGVPDAEYSIEQQIEADSPVMSEVNTEENPYEFSLELKTNGYAEDNLIVSRSGYATVIENEAMLGISTDVEIDSSCNPENIVLKYTIKNEYLDNTLGIYTDCEEFQGIKRLNVFKYFEEINMLLPIETQFDADNNLVYAEVDELGTYCIMDMEIWLNSLGVEPAAEEVNIDLSDIELNYDNDISIMSDKPTQSYNFGDNTYAIYDISGLTWEEAKEYCSSLGGHLVTITSIEEQSFIESFLTEGAKNSYWIGGNKVLDKWQWVTDENFSYTNWSQGNPDNCLDQEDKLMIYRFTNPVNSRGTFGYWNDLNNSGDCYGEEFFGAENLGFICEWDNFGNNQTEFEALVGTKWKTIKLKDVLNASNGVNSDTDSLTDWQEVNTKLLKWNDDGTFELPKLNEAIEIADYVYALSAFDRWKGTEYELPIKGIWERKVLPIISDPTEEDSDGDGLIDEKDEMPLRAYYAYNGRFGQIKYKGIIYDIHVPDQLNASFDAVWETTETIVVDDFNFDVLQFMFGLSFTDLENTDSQKIYGGSEQLNDTFEKMTKKQVEATKPKNYNAHLLWGLGGIMCSTIENIQSSISNYQISFKFQKHGEFNRVIIKAGNRYIKDIYSQYAGTTQSLYVINTGNVIAQLQASMMAKSIYQSLTNKEADKNSTYDILITIDESHKNAVYSSYLWINDEGIVETPILYSDDKVEIAKRTGFLNLTYKPIVNVPIGNPRLIDENYQKLFEEFMEEKS